ncbi:MAG: zinc-ribbon domain-containing protein [Christensenellaceae bacterium]|jgi:uncharacterized membrane protein|nr:zinc-ribbon domain-containing protein [Christensenellaceae bacterium]
MAFCGKCGAQVEEGAAFCPSCGTVVGEGAQSGAKGSDAEENKAMGILAYIGILVLIPLFAAKNSPFARYHSNQGLVMCIAAIAYSIAQAILTAIFTAISWTLGSLIGTLLSIASLAFLALMILGIINAAKGETKPLPVIGGIQLLK